MKEAEKAVENGRLPRDYSIESKSEKLPIATYKAMSIAESSLYNDLQSSLQQLKTMLAATQIHLTSAQLEKLYEPFLLTKLRLKECKNRRGIESG